MTEPRLQIKKRNLPHWRLDDSTYFVTFRLAGGFLSEPERRLVLQHIVAGHGRFYLLAAVVVMPDHVHMLLRPLPEITLSRIMKGIKGVSARIVNRHRGNTGQIWQDESWDRIVRDYAEFEEKLNYMADNPVKAGLVVECTSYCGWYCNGDLC